MKKGLLILLISAMLVSLTACQSLSTTDDTTDMAMNTQIFDEHLSISIPQDYQEASSQYIDKYFTKDDSASIIITNDTNPSAYYNAYDYYNVALQQYSSTFDSVTEISSQVTTVSNRYNALIAEFEYTIVSQDSVIDMTCYVEYILTDEDIYIVTCSSPTDTYSYYRDGFVQSVASILVS